MHIKFQIISMNKEINRSFDALSSILFAKWFSNALSILHIYRSILLYNTSNILNNYSTCDRWTLFESWSRFWDKFEMTKAIWKSNQFIIFIECVRTANHKVHLLLVWALFDSMHIVTTKDIHSVHLYMFHLEFATNRWCFDGIHNTHSPKTNLIRSHCWW